MKDRLLGMWYVVIEDRKKAGILGVLLLALGALAVKSMLSAGPNQSSAASGGDSSPGQVGQTALSRAAELVARLQRRQFREVPAAPRLSRDLFAVDERRFPPPIVEVPVRVEPPPERIEPVIKSDPEDADDLRAREIARIREEAEGFKLRSVVVGQNPLAVIELPGKRRTVVPLGGSVNGFKVEEVTTESVELVKDAVRVRLKLTVPKR